MGSDRPIKARAAALSRPVAATLEVDFATECLAAAKHDTFLSVLFLFHREMTGGEVSQFLEGLAGALRLTLQASVLTEIPRKLGDCVAVSRTKSLFLMHFPFAGITCMC